MTRDVASGETVVTDTQWSIYRYTWRWADDIVWPGVSEEQLRGWALAQMSTMHPDVGDTIAIDTKCSALANWAWRLHRPCHRLHPDEIAIATCVACDTIA